MKTLGSNPHSPMLDKEEPRTNLPEPLGENPATAMPDRQSHGGLPANMRPLPTSEEPDDTDEDDIIPSAAGGTTLYEHYRFTADKGQSLVRIDKYLYDRLEHVSRNRIQNAAEAGYIHVNGKPVKSNYRVKPQDLICILMHRPPCEHEVVPEEIPLHIVFEDRDVLVVDKPAGMVVHPGHGNWEGTLVNALAWHLRDNPDYDPNDPRVGLVHRIDKDTSGLLVVAKTPEAKTSLGKQFFHKTTKRKYNALVWGNFDQQGKGTIVGNIARDPRDRLRMTVSAAPNVGKPAVTHYQVIERFGYATYIECVLETGRTHQIRAHMAHIGHPLFNDERYGGNEILRGTRTSSYSQFVRNNFALCPRQALHARTLGFTHPRTGQGLTFESPLPEDMQQLLERWRRFVAGQHTP